MDLAATHSQQLEVEGGTGGRWGVLLRRLMCLLGREEEETIRLFRLFRQ